jgi:hypothetical protein
MKYLRNTLPEKDGMFMMESLSEYGTTDQLLKILLASEHARADAWLRRDCRALDALLAPDYYEINLFGRFSRDDILTRIFNLCTLHSFSINEPHVKRAGKDSAVITYQCTEDISMGKVRKTGTFAVEAHYSLKGNLWKLTRWQIISPLQ